MLGRPRGWKAASVQSAAIALALTVVVVGAGFGVQRAVLRSPTQGELAAARVELALLRYRLVRSTIHVAGEPVRHAECLEGWYRLPGRRSYVRGAQVLFADGERLEVSRRGARRTAVGRIPTRMPPIAEVELAGCARILNARIYAQLVGGRRTQAVDAHFTGHKALSLHVRTKRDRFDVFVDRETLVPLGVRVETADAVGWSVLDPVRPLTTAAKLDFLRRFDGG